jgi:hypothetical protein
VDFLDTAAPIRKQGGLPAMQGVVRQRLMALIQAIAGCQRCMKRALKICASIVKRK